VGLGVGTRSGMRKLDGRLAQAFDERAGGLKGVEIGRRGFWRRDRMAAKCKTRFSYDKAAGRFRRFEQSGWLVWEGRNHERRGRGGFADT